jgi:hypothetical protein
MAEKKNTGEDLKKNDSKEIIERLYPKHADDDEANSELGGERKIDDQSIDRLFQGDDKRKDDFIDHLLRENKKSVQTVLEYEVTKALSQPIASKASLYRMRTKEPSKDALSKEIAKLKTIEEIWEEPKSEAGNRKFVIVMYIFIALIMITGGWALWQSTKSERGNDANLKVLEKETKLKEQEKETLGKDIGIVSGIVDGYLSAKTLSEKSEYIYQAELFKNDIMAYYEDNGGVKSASNYSIENVLPMSLEGEQIREVLIKHDQSFNGELTSYYLRKNSDGDYKVDWKADVAFQENDVNLFIKTRSREATNIKFIVEPMYELGTYNWGFKDTEYKVLRLKIPNSDIVFWGYVKQNSEEQKRLNRFIEADYNNSVINKINRHEFILKVRFLAESPHENSEYVLVEDIISQKWINVDE